MDTNVMIFNNTVHVRFAHTGVTFTDIVLTPEQAADLSHQIILALAEKYDMPIPAAVTAPAAVPGASAPGSPTVPTVSPAGPNND